MPAEPWVLPRGEYLPPPDIAAIQVARWARQAAYVAEESAFYRGLWGGRAPDPRLEALAELPLTDKAMLRRDQAEHPALPQL